MQYFSYKGHSLALKNNLEKAISEFLIENDRIVIEEESLEAFKEKIISGINDLNVKFNRCKPRKAHWWSFGGGVDPSKDHSMGGLEFTAFTLYASKGNE